MLSHTFTIHCNALIHSHSVIPLQPPFFHLFFLGPCILFVLDKLVSVSRNTIKIDIISAKQLPSSKSCPLDTLANFLMYMLMQHIPKRSAIDLRSDNKFSNDENEKIPLSICVMCGGEYHTSLSYSLSAIALDIQFTNRQTEKYYYDQCLTVSSETYGKAFQVKDVVAKVIAILYKSSSSSSFSFRCDPPRDPASSQLQLPVWPVGQDSIHGHRRAGVTLILLFVLLAFNIPSLTELH